MATCLLRMAEKPVILLSFSGMSSKSWPALDGADEITRRVLNSIQMGWDVWMPELSKTIHHCW